MDTATTALADRTYVSSLRAYKDGELKTSFLAQPYIVGMYVIINNDSAMQLNIEHKKYPSWVKGSIKKMEKLGYKVEVTETKYTNYISKKDLKTYDVLK